jgi:hypothetical protein
MCTKKLSLQVEAITRVVAVEVEAQDDVEAHPDVGPLGGRHELRHHVPQAPLPRGLCHGVVVGLGGPQGEAVHVAHGEAHLVASVQAGVKRG